MIYPREVKPMLKRFSVTNFKNFHKKMTMHFDDVKDYGFNNEGLIKMDASENRLINKALVYGDNGSGKSNLGFAIMELNNHLTDKLKNPTHYLDFINADSSSPWATFEYVLSDKKGKEIIYQYTKNSSLRFGYEKLSYDGKLIYEYDYEERRLVNTIEEAKTLDFSKLTNDISGIKYIRSTIPLPEDHPIRFLVDFAEGMLWFRSVRDNEFMGIEKAGENLDPYLGDPDRLKGFNDFLNECGLDYELVTYLHPLSKTPMIGAKYRNRILNFFSIASSGTASLALLWYWLDKGRGNIDFLFIDEFDAFYHHDLAKQILKLINSKDEFQSVLTTHNTFLMSNSFMRPDTYFLLEDNQIASMAESTTKVIREGNNLERMYRANEFINQ